jgi:hypothetical protein
MTQALYAHVNNKRKKRIEKKREAKEELLEKRSNEAVVHLHLSAQHT